MNEHELRLECLKLANSPFERPTDIAKRATVYLGFVIGFVSAQSQRNQYKNTQIRRPKPARKQRGKRS